MVNIPTLPQVVLKNKANDILIGSLVYTAYPQSKLGRVEGCSGNSVIVRLCDRTSSPSADVCLCVCLCVSFSWRVFVCLSVCVFTVSKLFICLSNCLYNVYVCMYCCLSSCLYVSICFLVVTSINQLLLLLFFICSTRRIFKASYYINIFTPLLHPRNLK